MSSEFHAIIAVGTLLAALILTLYVSIFRWNGIIKRKKRKIEETDSKLEWMFEAEFRGQPMPPYADET
jgi:hypothetical protein